MVLGAIFLFLGPLLFIGILLFPVFLWLKSKGKSSWFTYSVYSAATSLLVGALFIIGISSVSGELPDYYAGFLILCLFTGVVFSSVLWRFGISRKSNNVPKSV